MRHPELLSGSDDSSVGEKCNLKIYFLGVLGLNPLMSRGNSHCGRVRVCPFVLICTDICTGIAYLDIDAPLFVESWYRIFRFRCNFLCSFCLILGCVRQDSLMFTDFEVVQAVPFNFFHGTSFEQKGNPTSGPPHSYHPGTNQLEQGCCFSTSASFSQPCTLLSCSLIVSSEVVSTFWFGKNPHDPKR